MPGSLYLGSTEGGKGGVQSLGSMGTVSVTVGPWSLMSAARVWGEGKSLETGHLVLDASPWAALMPFLYTSA